MRVLFLFYKTKQPIIKFLKCAAILLPMPRMNLKRRLQSFVVLQKPYMITQVFRLRHKREVTSKIVRNCNRMAALIKDLLTLADIENIPSSRLVIVIFMNLAEHCRSMLLEVFPDAQVSIDKRKEELILIADRDLLELAHNEFN